MIIQTSENYPSWSSSLSVVANQFSDRQTLSIWFVGQPSKVFVTSGYSIVQNQNRFFLWKKIVHFSEHLIYWIWIIKFVYISTIFFCLYLFSIKIIFICSPHIVPLTTSAGAKKPQCFKKWKNGGNFTWNTILISSVRSERTIHKRLVHRLYFMHVIRKRNDSTQLLCFFLHTWYNFGLFCH